MILKYFNKITFLCQLRVETSSHALLYLPFHVGCKILLKNSPFGKKIQETPRDNIFLIHSADKIYICRVMFIKITDGLHTCTAVVRLP